MADFNFNTSIERKFQSNLDFGHFLHKNRLTLLYVISNVRAMIRNEDILVVATRMGAPMF